MSVMPDRDIWLMPLVVAGICAAGMAVLVAGIALALGTTGHDWYAAWKFTLVEAMLTVGFSDYGVVDYRTAAGETITVQRYQLAYVMGEAWWARRQIFSLVANRAVLGACTGLALFAMWMGGGGRGAPAAVRGRRGMVVEPAPRVRPGYAGRMHRPDDWSDGELIAALARRSGRVGVLLVSPAEVERLAGGGDDAGRSATHRESLPPTRTPGLPSPEGAEPVGEAAVPAKPPPADPGRHQDTTKTDKAPGSRAVARRRELGEQFF